MKDEHKTTKKIARCDKVHEQKTERCREINIVIEEVVEDDEGVDDPYNEEYVILLFDDFC